MRKAWRIPTTGRPSFKAGQGGLVWSCAGFLLSLRVAYGVIFVSTSDPSYNTTVPDGAAAQHGWDLQGEWGNFLGTPVSSNCFLTARHVGGAIGDSFSFHGSSYRVAAFYDSPDSDLRLCQVEGAFDSFAQVYSTTNETGKGLIVFGRGTQRGTEVMVGSVLKGWQWGAADGKKRWGENVVESVVDGDALLHPDGAGPATIGDLLRATFDSDGGPNEAQLSVGDSGGGVFLQAGSDWKLAGINYAVDGPYSLSDAGPGFEAAVFDQTGLYVQDESSWVYVPSQPAAEPGSFYATRVSVHLDWIQNVLSEIQRNSVVLESAASPDGPYATEPAASVDLAAQTITIASPERTRFYRLTATSQRRITSIRESPAGLVIRYE